MKTNRRDLLKGLFAAPLVKLTDEEAQATIQAEKRKVRYERNDPYACTAAGWFSATSRVDIQK